MSQQNWGQQQWNAPRPNGTPSAGWNSPFGQQPPQQQWPQMNPYGNQPSQGGQAPYSSGPGLPAPQQQRYPQPQQGQQWPAPGQFQQQRRRSLGCGKVIIAAVVIMVGLSVLGGLLSSLGGDDNAGTSTQVPSGDYQNEDYTPPPADLNPPPLPQPETYEEATQLLEANPFYDQSVPAPVRCDLPDLDMTSASNSELEAHLNELMGCLMRVWVDPVTAAGYELPRPSVTVYSGSVTTACGKAPSHNAFYCGADQQVYYADDLPEVVPPELRTGRFVIETVVAHEFAHAIQARTAILISSMAWEQRVGKAKAKVYSRRMETQADCLSGEFLFSISASKSMSEQDLSTVSDLYYSIGDDVLTGEENYDGEHGLGKNRRYWGQMGLASSKVGACNTWVVPESQVR